jgi:hypothetical protein
MTAATATNDPVVPPPKRPRRLWRIIIALLITAISLLTVVSWLRPPPARFELISTQDYERRTERFAFLQKARGWMTRFSPKIFGFARVEISASYVQIGRSEKSELSAHLPRPLYSSNAVRVWILASNEVARLERDLRTTNSARWRVSAADGISSVLSTGPVDFFSLEFATHPKIRRDAIDLGVIVRSVSTHTISGGLVRRTNHETSFRAFLKADEGGIIMDESGVLFVWAHAPRRQ